MRRLLTLTLAAALAVLATGCASVTGSSNQSVSLQTRDHDGEEVEDAKCELSNDKGKWFVTTPGSVVIQKSNQDMQILCKKPGHETGRQAVVSETKGSMYGNVILGGGIGALVDHSTGAAYEYPNFIRVVMRPLGKKDTAGTANPAAPKPAEAVVALAPQAANMPAPTAVLKLAPMRINGKKPQTGDEWEYLAQDRLFGKQKKLVWRVKSVESSGVHEELLVDGISTRQWVFGTDPTLIGAPVDVGFLFSQHWDTMASIPRLSVSGISDCIQKFKCTLDARIVGYETVTVAAGTFETVRIDGVLTINPAAIPDKGTVTFWYSEKNRRLVKQVASLRAPRFGFVVDETVELQAARSYQ